MAAEAARASTSWPHRRHIVQTLEPSCIRRSFTITSAQAAIKVVTEDRQSMRLQAEKLQADMEGNEKFVFEAWEALRAAEE